MLAVGGAPEEEAILTRCGYVPSESIKSFEKSLTQAGPISTGRALHFAADVVCSGGFESFARSLWDYAICHVGLASPRIFVYLKKRVGELEDMLKRLPDEQAYGLEEFQVRIGELVLVVRGAPNRTAIPWPKVGAETHADSWIRAVAGTAPETAALRRVWRPEGDLSILRTVGAELCKAIGDGSTEKALFWVKWLFEEEARMRKEVKGGTLSTVDRGPPGAKGSSKGGVGFFVLALYAEIYKELGAKGVIRMNEEFQALLDLWRTGDKRIQGGAKKQILAVLTQMLCEVPRWKVPAAPALIQDPVVMSTAIRQVTKFFKEVLAYDPPRGSVALVKAFKSRGKIDSKAAAAAKKGDSAADKMDAFDRALEAYFSRQ
jgi:hypothetical protein